MAGIASNGDSGSDSPVRSHFYIVFMRITNLSLLQLPKCPLLPGELWQDIMEYLPKSDLKALATVHRVTRFHAIPLLYRKVTIYTVHPTSYRKAKGLVEAPDILRWINTLAFEAPVASPVTSNTDIFNSFVTFFSKMSNLRELKLACIYLDKYAQSVILETPLVSLAFFQCQFTCEKLAPTSAHYSSVRMLRIFLGEDPNFPDSPPTFLTHFPNVETLDLMVAPRDYTCFPKFPSLTSLTIHAITLGTLRVILRQSPHLARLWCFHRDLRGDDGTPTKIPACNISRLLCLR